MNIIELNNISRVFKAGDNEIHALDGISIKVKKGEMLAIMGCSGSGKSTMLNIVGLLDDATNGEYYLNGENTHQYNYKKKAALRNSTFGFVVQDFALVEQYTVKQNIELPFTYSHKRFSREEKEQRIAGVLSDLNISDKKDALTYTLSGGQRQRVAIARALVCSPEIILADEPTGALDSRTSKEIMEIFLQLNKMGKTVLVITHDRKVAEYCSRIVEISDGRILPG